MERFYWKPGELLLAKRLHSSKHWCWNHLSISRVIDKLFYSLQMHPVPIFELVVNYDLLIQTINLSTFNWLPHEVKTTEWIYDVRNYCILWWSLAYGFRRPHNIRIIWGILSFWCWRCPTSDSYIWLAMCGPVMNGWASFIWAGWEYRHWDDMLKLLVGTTIDHYHEKKEFASPRPLDVVQKN